MDSCLFVVWLFRCRSSGATNRARKNNGHSRRQWHDPRGLMMRFGASKMNRVAVCLLVALLSFDVQAKSYSSGSHSYSSSSSSHSSRSSSSHSSSSGNRSFSSGGGHTFSSGGSSTRSSGSGSTRTFNSGGSSSRSSGSGSSHTFSSGGTSTRSSGGSGSSVTRTTGSSGSKSKSFSSSGGRSYSSGSTFSEGTKHSYTAGKSYSSGSGHAFSSGNTVSASIPSQPAPLPKSGPGSSASSFSFDTAAARASREEASKQQFTRFKDSQVSSSDTRSVQRSAEVPPATAPSTATRSESYRVAPPPIPATTRREVYIPDTRTYSSRPVRTYDVFNPYASRPVVIYNDSYSSLFWWWLLDRSLEDRAWWAYHHRYDMDPARYQALVQTDQQLEARVAQLETQEAARDPNYTPAGLDRDLMYSDDHITRVYTNRPTTSGRIAFYALGVPMALGMVCFFIWLIWFKRWQVA